MRDPYLFEDCYVLRNKLGIKDSALLDLAEVDITCKAIYDISVSPVKGKYDFAHLCKLHACIFGSIYDWAGKPRTVAMEKEEAMLGYMSIEYAHPKNIENEATIILNRMNSTVWDLLSSNERAIKLASDLAAIRPRVYVDNKTETRIDGNNVDIDHENLNISKQKLQYDYLIQRISGAYSSLRHAVMDGR